MNRQELLEIEGTVEAITFRKEETGFTVLQLAADNELITVVGEMADIHEGEELKVMGVFANHPSFGPQFRMSAFERKLPATVGAMVKYLSSGSIKGIGPVTARRIVDCFGPDTLNVIETEPDRLTEVRGITLKKAREIGEEFQRLHGIRTVMAFLDQYGITASESVAIWKRWGTAAVDLIRENPFILCCDSIGVNFETADEIRERLDIQPDADCRIKGAIFHVLRHNTLNGHTCLPLEKLIKSTLGALNFEENRSDEVLSYIGEEIAGENLISCDYKGKSFLFLPDFYTAEQYIAARLAMMIRSFSDTKMTYDQDIDRVEQETGIQYAEKQREAISSAMSKGLLILTGGPGTGKTTTLNGIIRLYQQHELKVALAAPTGRAAKRLSEVTGQEAKTIHRLLEVEYTLDGELRFVKNEKNPLNSDVVIIDEMSMVDVKLFESLLRGVKLSCKLILVGDDDQLPPVGAGYVLKSMIDSKCVPFIKLTDIFRQAADSMIVTNAHAIIRGKNPDLSIKNNDFFFLKSYNYAKTAGTVVDLCSYRLPDSYGFSPLWDIQVLAPTRLGELGTNTLNLRLQEALNPAQPQKPQIKFGPFTYRLGDKVMQTRNNYDILWDKDGEKGTGIFNGDIGVITEIDRAEGAITIRFDDKTAYYTTDMLSEIELAYAITVHKSQGSEYDAVIIPLMNNHAKLYYRSLFYTAVTRAKKLVIILGQEQTVYHMVENNKISGRYTCLKGFIREECGWNS